MKKYGITEIFFLCLVLFCCICNLSIIIQISSGEVFSVGLFFTFSYKLVRHYSITVMIGNRGNLGSVFQCTRIQTLHTSRSSSPQSYSYTCRFGLWVLKLFLGKIAI